MHYSDSITDPETKRDLIRVCVRLQRLSEDAGQATPRNWDKVRFNPWEIVQGQVKRGIHPGAILKALEHLAERWPQVKKPQGYVLQVLKIESQNFHEQDHHRRINETSHVKPVSVGELLNRATAEAVRTVAPQAPCAPPPVTGEGAHPYGRGKSKSGRRGSRT